jgi:ABC-2 type transport system ATP-binding protein
MIRLHNVTMRYPISKRIREYVLRPLKKKGEITAIHNIDLRIAEGSCLGLLGPNGAGKTTLLKLIGGLLYPTKGIITVNDYDTQEYDNEIQQSVSYVLNEDRSFYWRLTGIQNLEFFGALDEMYGNYLQERISDLMELTGLKDAGDIRVSNYSSGMRQRLAIARALLADPRILLLDEPTKSLDPLGAEDIRQLISNDIHSDGCKTLIVATHDLYEAETLCDNVCVILKGRIIASATKSDIFSEWGGIRQFYKAAITKSWKSAC